MVEHRTLSHLPVLVCIANGSEEMESVNIIDVLRRGDLEVIVAKISNNESEKKDLKIVASRGVKLEADHHFEEVSSRDFSVIVLPGGMGGAQAFAANHQLLERLQKQKSSNRIVAAICASPAVVLTKNKLLDGITKVTCYPSASLKEKIPHSHEWLDQKVVVDHNVVTSQGPFTAAHFGLKLIELLQGKEKSEEVAKGILLH